VIGTTTGSLPPAGVTVVALEQAVAGPLATRHLADLGARVVKIERSEEGDFARDYDHAVNGLASHFVWLNQGKESLAIDLKSSRGLRIARALIARADVFLHNTAPGVVERLGLDAATLRSADPRLVVVNISGYRSLRPAPRPQGLRPSALHAALRRQADPADGAQPRGDRPVGRLSDRRRADPDRRAERPGLADAGERRLRPVRRSGPRDTAQAGPSTCREALANASHVDTPNLLKHALS
jgi:hypothetical protein